MGVGPGLPSFMPFRLCSRHVFPVFCSSDTTCSQYRSPEWRGVPRRDPRTGRAISPGVIGSKLVNNSATPPPSGRARRLSFCRVPPATSSRAPTLRPGAFADGWNYTVKENSNQPMELPRESGNPASQKWRRRWWTTLSWEWRNFSRTSWASRGRSWRTRERRWRLFSNPRYVWKITESWKIFFGK